MERSLEDAVHQTGIRSGQVRWGLGTLTIEQGLGRKFVLRK